MLQPLQQGLLDVVFGDEVRHHGPPCGTSPTPPLQPRPACWAAELDVQMIDAEFAGDQAGEEGVSRSSTFGSLGSKLLCLSNMGLASSAKRDLAAHGAASTAAALEPDPAHNIVQNIRPDLRDSLRICPFANLQRKKSRDAYGSMLLL
jgi:hypothetical protein